MPHPHKEDTMYAVNEVRELRSSGMFGVKMIREAGQSVYLVWNLDWNDAEGQRFPSAGEAEIAANVRNR